jgi:5'-nucleotidase (lipoprotein e(P4) family)
MIRTPVALCLLAFQIALGGCGSARTASPQSVAAVPGAPALPLEIRWVQASAEYEAILRQTYRLAQAAVEDASAGRAAGSWGVALDADETVISSLTYQRERAAQGLGYSPESWRAWVRRREATPLPGAAAFLHRVRALGGRIAIVTSRLQSECADTEAVLRQHELPYDDIFCRPDEGSGDKAPRFEQAASTLAAAGQPPLEMLAFVGDNIQDFPGQSQALRGSAGDAFAAFGSRFFVIPNPMYGSWQ